MMEDAPLLSVDALRVAFPSRAGTVRAVDGVSFEVHAGRTLAIVGESGSGKTVSALALLGLLPRGAQVEGSARLGERNLFAMSRDEIRRIRGNEVAMIFQDPFNSLNPVQRIGAQIVEALRAHERPTRRAARERAVELLRLVGLPDAERRIDAYPHELSGGMRQRVMIAIALSASPTVLIADEPTTALDVTVQAQILELLGRLQAEMSMALVLITHDLGIVAQVADEVLVMYAGRMVERGTTSDIFTRAQHPYTWGLLGSLPRTDRAQARLASIPGAPPSPLATPPGCPFHPRCAFRFEPCDRDRPELIRRGHHEDACHLAYEDKERERPRVLGDDGR